MTLDNMPKFSFSLFVALFAILIVAIKWGISFYLFPNESLLNKVIFEIPDIYYFPYILNILEFNFSPDYLDQYKSETLIPIPIYSIFIHSFFFKFFNLYSFLILEFISLIIFFLILLNIFKRIGLNNTWSLLLIMIIFLIPSVFENLSKLNFTQINFNAVSNLYSFRFPRPLITSLYFFWGLYLAINYFLNKKNTLKDYIIISICLSLCFVSYYYHFVNLVILFFILFMTKYLNNKKLFIENSKYLFLSILIFIILISPFLILLYLSHNDFAQMMGVFDLNLERKVELLVYLLSKIFSIKFFSIFLLITLFFLFLLKSANFFDKKTILTIYLFFISSFISPFLFIVLSPSVSEIYNFLNWIVIIGVFVFSIYLTLFINFLLDKFNYKKTFKFTPVLLIFLFFSYFQFNLYNQQKNKQDNDFRYELSNLQSFLINNYDDLDSILSFIPQLQIWWMFNNKRQFTTIDSSFSSLNFAQLEKSFIDNMKFLNVSNENFKNIIANNKTSWRYDNKYIKYFSWYKYQANSLVSYQNTTDFDEDELKYILQSKPTKAQQIVIPKFEIDRLMNLYKKYQSKEKLIKPDIVIIKKGSKIDKFSQVDFKNYCKVNDFSFLKVYLKKVENSC